MTLVGTESQGMVSGFSASRGEVLARLWDGRGLWLDGRLLRLGGYQLLPVSH